mmetsp:Transcript_16557/g.27239  ORF Transcript_16557/g.27239 Transcript_16557/m.27239 type:complete len:231 (+) Transcript_16557:445-1137(+)
MLLHNIRPNHHTIRNIHQQIQHHIHSQKSLRQYDPSNRTIIQSPFKPLIGMSIRRTGGQTHNVPTQRTASLGPHGVTFVGHGRTSNLILGKWFFYLLQVGKETDIPTHLIGRLSNPTQETQDVIVNLACVGLSTHGNHLLKSHGLTYLAIQLLHLVMIAIEQLQKRRLSPSSPLHTPHGQILQFIRHTFIIQQQILHPQRTALPHRGQLSRLIMRKSQRWQIGILLGKGL